MYLPSNLNDTTIVLPANRAAKPFWLVGLVLFVLTTTATAQSLVLCFDENCRIAIDGNTNVSPYQCALFERPGNDTIHVYSYTKNNLFYLENAIVKLRAKSFKCNNRAMTSDFLAALKADKYPWVKIEFDYFNLTKPLNELTTQRNVPVHFYVTIAGIKRGYLVTYDYVKLEKTMLSVNGRINIKMSDFNITPPEALFGTIKVKDEISMLFNVRFCVSH
jgi:hypothetical protein